MSRPPAPAPKAISHIARSTQKEASIVAASLPPPASTALLVKQLEDRVKDLKFDKQPSRSSFHRGAVYKVHDGPCSRSDPSTLDEEFKHLMGKGSPSDQIKVHDSRMKDIETSILKALQVSTYIHWFTATTAKEFPVLQPDADPHKSTPIPNSALHTADDFFDSLGEAVLDLDRHLLWMWSQLTLIRRTSYIKQLPGNIDPMVKDKLYSAPIFGVTLFGERVQGAIEKRDQALERKKNEDFHQFVTQASPRQNRSYSKPQTPRSPRTPRKGNQRDNNNYTPRKKDQPRTPAKSPWKGRGQKRF